MNSTNTENEIRFSLDTTKGVPVYRQIIRQIEYAILSGRLQAGDRLPTIRSLAVDLKINPNTIAKAYGELEIRGILNKQVGSGTYISGKKPAGEEDARDLKIQEVLGRFMEEARSLGLSKKELMNLIEAYDERSMQ
ncbi:MAG: GntR family transcriptional regulator [Treponema sp.]|jgi:GntR family transcriptional regulator|nr:GntR family transcriptional regulator [Treponema sp.]